jgi:hypothetical protein
MCLELDGIEVEGCDDEMAAPGSDRQHGGTLAPALPADFTTHR